MKTHDTASCPPSSVPELRSVPWDDSAGPPVDLIYSERGHGKGVLAPDDLLEHRFILQSTAEAGRLIDTIAKGDHHG